MFATLFFCLSVALRLLIHNSMLTSATGVRLRYILLFHAFHIQQYRRLCFTYHSSVLYVASCCLNMCLELKVFIVLVSGSSVLSFVSFFHISSPHSHIVSLVCPLFREFSNIRGLEL